MNDSYMRKFLLFFFSIFVLTVMAEKTIYLHKTDGTKETYLASAVDSIGFVNVHTITFNANGGTGSMDVLCVKEGESITLPTNEFTNAKAEFASWNTATDGSGTAYTDQSTITPTANMTLYAQWLAPEHEYVDLGLPSGTKWATCNVGADSPEEYGDYFAWGETTPKEVYNWSTYKWCNGSETALTKYCTKSDYGIVDNKTVLDLADDAANANWGGNWRMPTDAELIELKDNCTWKWATQKGVNGYKVISKKNGNSIFLPAAGCRIDSDLTNAGSSGRYRKNSLEADGSDGVNLGFSSNFVGWVRYNRSVGLSVRPVMAK